jgi:hypothetical protein
MFDDFNEMTCKIWNKMIDKLFIQNFNDTQKS